MFKQSAVGILERKNNSFVKDKHVFTENQIGSSSFEDSKV